MKLNIVLSVTVAGVALINACNSQRPIGSVSPGTDMPLEVVQNSRPNGIPVGEIDNRVSYRGVSFLIDENLSADLVMNEIAATPADDNTIRPDGIDARHLSFRFIKATSHREPSFPPELKVYKLNEFVSTLEGVDEYGINLKGKIEALKKAIAEGFKPKDSSDYPFVPFVDATKVLQARAAKVQFEKGRGLMYITQFRHSDPVLVNNRDLVLIFQGISNDGKYLVSATFPLSASFLPDVRYGVAHNGYSIPDDFYEKPELNERNYAAYLKMAQHQLDAAADEQFSPRPSMLLGLFSSLTIESSTLDGQ